MSVTIMSVTLARCGKCGHACYPARQICHRCGHADWTSVEIEDGVVEQVTTIRHRVDAAPGDTAIHLAALRTDAGPIILARLATPAAAGTRLKLRLMPDGAAWAGEPRT
jgi:uncharacterized OB-fold protein